MKAFQLTIFFLLLCIFWGCRNPEDDYIDPRGSDYAGAQSCVQCHPNAASGAQIHAHLKATQIATPQNLLGKFNPPQNNFLYDDKSEVVMEIRDGKACQVWYQKDQPPKVFLYGIVFGNHHAQTAVFWKDQTHTAELPVSYYRSVDDWATSPGFSSNAPDFNRNVDTNCFECHSSNAAGHIVKGPSIQHTSIFAELDDAINPKAFVAGIDCERCHGPARKHVDYHLKFPKVKTAQHIKAFGSLTQKQQHESCAICHSGNDHRAKVASRFNFRPGDALSEFYRAAASTEEKQYDVHGNQNGLLMQSECFKQSGAMSCVSCHNVHAKKEMTLSDYSAVCISCHQQTKHTSKTAALTITSKQNCVGCHMPKQQSQSITFKRPGRKDLEHYELRTHKIGVYTNEDQRKR